jgi:hypothetical protein
MGRPINENPINLIQFYLTLVLNQDELIHILNLMSN